MNLLIVKLIIIYLKCIKRKIQYPKEYDISDNGEEEELKDNYKMK